MIHTLSSSHHPLSLEVQPLSSACLSQIAFVSTTGAGYKETRLWVNYHQVIGVTHFYLFVDGVAARPEVLHFTPPLSFVITAHYNCASQGHA